MKAKMFAGSKWAAIAAGAALFSFGALAQPSPDSPPAAPVAAAGNPTIPADLSPGLAQVVKLAEANVGDDVILSYIKTSGQTTTPTADEILYLKDVGVSDAVITALLQNPAPAVAPAPVVQATPAPVPPPVSTSAPAQEVTTAYFQEQLSPYGSWVDVPDYGRCWQPAVVVANPGWRPYGDRGHWVYTDAGWYWQSDYSWGWATFHYGRWFNHGRYGWVWAPDNVWGPSWVCWRQTDVQCGWAPLPPGARFDVGVGLFFHGARVSAGFDFGLNLGLFTFVGFDHFCDRDVHRYYVPRREVVNIYNRSTVINNYTVVNRRVVNEGFGRERVAAISHRPVTRVSIHETTTFTPGHVDHASRNGSLNVFRPTPQVMASHVETPHREPFVVNRTTTTTVNSTTVKRASDYRSSGVNTERGGVNAPRPVTTTRTETIVSPRTITTHNDPVPSRTVTPPSHTVTPPAHTTSIPERTVAPRSEPSVPSSSPFSTTGHHAVEHPSYQPRGWTGNSESAPSTSHSVSSSSAISPHQSSAPSVSHMSEPTYGHSYSAPQSAPVSRPAAPSAPSSSPGRSGSDRRNN